MPLVRQTAQQNPQRKMWLLPLLLATVQVALSAQAAPHDPLPSWNNGNARKTILDFVSRVTNEGSPGFVPVAERIATFDNDGTLWVEQPVYVQIAFALDRIKTLAPQHPEWKQQQPFKAVLEDDMETLTAGGEKAMAQILMATQTGMTTSEFEAMVKEWLAKAK